MYLPAKKFKAVITNNGSHLVHPTYDSLNKVAYITVWNLESGLVERRLRDEPGICALDVGGSADIIAFTLQSSFLKVWQPFV